MSHWTSGSPACTGWGLCEGCFSGALKISAGKGISCEPAVGLFKEWGFVVEEGPEADEASVMVEAPDHKTYWVYEAQ